MAGPDHRDRKARKVRKARKDHKVRKARKDHRVLVVPGHKVHRAHLVRKDLMVAPRVRRVLHRALILVR
jgi:hypothetical protein